MAPITKSRLFENQIRRIEEIAKELKIKDFDQALRFIVEHGLTGVEDVLKKKKTLTKEEQQIQLDP